MILKGHSLEFQNCISVPEDCFYVWKWCNTNEIYQSAASHIGLDKQHFLA